MLFASLALLISFALMVTTLVSMRADTAHNALRTADIYRD